MNFKKLKYDPRKPKHVAIIIDGNGRWAEKRGLPRSAGHKVGAENIRRHIELLYDLGIENLSIFAFSCENWNRPQKEVDYLMELFDNILDEYKKDKIDEDVRFLVSGDLTDERIPVSVRTKANELMKSTANGKKMTVNLCINYGGRQDIIRAVNNLILQGKTVVSAEDIDRNLYTKDMYPLDFLIRTSGEMRISNFMLWQASYSEFYFHKKNWPAFSRKDMLKCLVEYTKRNRRFGGIKE